MKKKIGEIYNKPIVTGDKNLVTKNEIHEESLRGGSGAELIYIDFKKLYSQIQTVQGYHFLAIAIEPLMVPYTEQYIYPTIYIDGLYSKFVTVVGTQDTSAIKYVAIYNKLFLPLNISVGSGVGISSVNHNSYITLEEYILTILNAFVDQIGYSEDMAKLLIDGAMQAYNELKVTEKEVLEWLKSE